MMMMMHHHRPELGGRSGGLPTMRMMLRAHHSIDEVMGFPWSPHLPSSAGYSSQTAPVPAMVAAGGPKKEACAQLISSYSGEMDFRLRIVSLVETRNGDLKEEEQSFPTPSGWLSESE